MKVQVRQRDITDCGAASLASIAAHYKLRMPVARIRQYAGTDKKGTNILGLTEAAQKMGFSAKGIRCDFEGLAVIPKPAIAHTVVDGELHHYVVVYKLNEQYVEVMDPAEGRLLRKSHADFQKEWTGVMVLCQPDKSFKAGNEAVGVGLRFWQLLRTHKGMLFRILLGAVIYTALGLSISVFVEKIVDQVLVARNRSLLDLMGYVMIGLVLIQGITGFAKAALSLKTAQRIDSGLILGYYRHLLKLPQQFFDTMRIGEILSRINDAVKIRAFVNDISINLAVNIFVVIFSAALMFSHYWKLALVVLAAVPVYILIYAVTNQLNKKLQRQLMEESAEVESQLVESITAIGTIKRLGLEPFAVSKTESRFTQFFETMYKSGLTAVFSAVSSESISRLFTVVLLWAGAVYVLHGQITAGELLSFYALASFFTAPATALISVNKTVQEAVIATERLFEIMDLEQEPEAGHPENIVAGDICFKDVSFRYGSRDQIFEDLSLTIPQGKVTAIVGESGSGKSTIMALIQQLYPLQTGDIYIGDVPVSAVRKSDLRLAVGVVPQQIDLFNGNILENITIGDPTPDLRRMYSICKDLGILAFIEKLPGGFYTPLGENAAVLSGGQKQRIAIARALYREPEILLLDEATSSLDPHAELYVQRTIDYLRKKGKTIVCIAHRLSTVQYADKIIVLEQGKVKEEGIHEELILTDGSYAQLWNQQFKPNPILNESF